MVVVKHLLRSKVIIEGNKVEEGTVINHGTTCKLLQADPQPGQLKAWRKSVPGRVRQIIIFTSMTVIKRLTTVN